MDKVNRLIIFLFLFSGISLLFTACSNTGKTGEKQELFAPHLSKNAQILLKYIYDISGEYTLTGQHSYLGRLSLTQDSLFKMTGKYPALWGSDFGFAADPGGIDEIERRPELIEEIKKQHQLGSIISMTYHQASPTIGEPCPFVGGVEIAITESDWDDILTPGTPLHKEWRAQMDRIAVYLQQLKEARIPILFRPYHEMNGAWFWWGGQAGEERFVALWKQLYQLYTEDYKFNNLIWVWSPDDPEHGLEGYYPGDEYADIVGCDIYHYGKTGPIYNQPDYDAILSIAPEKPLCIGETSEIPTDSIIGEFPKWTWFMAWEGHIFERNSQEKINAVYHSERFLTRDELPDFNFK